MIYTVILATIGAALFFIYGIGWERPDSGLDAEGEGRGDGIEAKEDKGLEEPQAGVAGVASAAATKERGPFSGMTAPEFKLKDLEGSYISLSDHKGKVLFLNFWATWCPWCRVEMPDIQRIKYTYGDKIELLAIAVRDEEDEIRKFFGDNGFDIRVALDPSGRMLSEYILRGIPSSFIIDRDGVVRFRRVGTITFEEAKREIDKILEKQNDFGVGEACGI